MRTGRFTHIVAAAALVVGVATLQSGVILSGAQAAGASEPGHGSYNCPGGNIPPGTYKSMTISGVCFMSDRKRGREGKPDRKAGGVARQWHAG